MNTHTYLFCEQLSRAFARHIYHSSCIEPFKNRGELVHFDGLPLTVGDNVATHFLTGSFRGEVGFGRGSASE